MLNLAGPLYVVGEDTSKLILFGFLRVAGGSNHFIKR